MRQNTNDLKGGQDYGTNNTRHDAGGRKGYVGDDAGPEVFEKLNRLITSGPFEVHVARTLPLEHAAEAHRALDEHYLGKLALLPSAR